MKLRCFWEGPGWIVNTHPPQYYPIPPCTSKTVQKYHPKLSMGLKVYLFVQFFLNVGLQQYFLLQYRALGSEGLGYAVIYSIAALFVLGSLCDRAKMGFEME